MKTFQDLRSAWRPCAAAVQWAARQPAQSLAVLWASCPRGDWLVWALEQLKLETRPIMFRAVDVLRVEVVAELSALYMYTDKKRGVKQMLACLPATDGPGLLVVRDTALRAMSDLSPESAEWRTLAALMMAADEGWRVCTFGGSAATVVLWAAARGAYAARLADQVREMTPWTSVEAALDAAKENA